MRRLFTKPRTRYLRHYFDEVVRKRKVKVLKAKYPRYCENCGALYGYSEEKRFLWFGPKYRIANCCE